MELNTSIIALTFSNKAKQELKSRVENLIRNSQTINVHTFHSFCSNILRTYGQNYLGTLVNNNHSFNSQFSILSEDDSIRVIKKLFRQNQITHLNESRVFNQIIQQKESIITNWYQHSTNTLLNSSSLSSSSISHSLKDPLLQSLFESYEQQLRNNNSVDFSDLLILTWRLLREYPVIRQTIQNRYQHILIDEYQDTNHIQYELTKLLFQPPSNESLKLQSNTEDQNDNDYYNNDNNNRSLFVVGDINQSIYSWRGAYPENLSLLEKDFHNSVKFELKQNYRCSPQISTIANTILGNISTTASSHKNESDYLPVYIYAAKDDTNQAEFICRSLQNMKGKTRAILYRTNAQSHSLEVTIHFIYLFII